jgi:hypothetical protein
MSKLLTVEFRDGHVHEYTCNDYTFDSDGLTLQPYLFFDFHEIRHVTEHS